MYVKSLNYKALFAGVLLNLAGASLQFSTKNLKCDTVFIWTGASTNMFDVQITKDGNEDPWNKTNNPEFRVNDTLFFKHIKIVVRAYIRRHGTQPYNDSDWNYNGISCSGVRSHITTNICKKKLTTLNSPV